MSTPPFESLRGRLIEDGCTPRYSRRLTGELSDHHEQLRVELISRGLDPDVAAESARQRIGTDDEILNHVRARQQHRSLVRRRPIWCFVLAPVMAMAMTAFTLAIVVAIVAQFIPLGPASPAPALSYLATRLLLPISAAFLAMVWITHAHRRRCSWRWPLLASTLFAAMCSTVGIQVMSPTSGSPGTIAIGIGPPPQNWLMLLPLAMYLAFWILLRPRAMRRHQPTE